MLSQLKAIQDDPENVPELTPIQREMLQARFNGGHLMTNGTIAFLQRQGHSESFIFGYIAGMNAVCGLLDDFEFVREDRAYEEGSNVLGSKG